MTTAKRRKAVAAIRQIVEAARELIELEGSASAQTPTPANGEVAQAVAATVDNETVEEPAHDG